MQHLTHRCLAASLWSVSVARLSLGDAPHLGGVQGIALVLAVTPMGSDALGAFQPHRQLGQHLGVAGLVGLALPAAIARWLASSLPRTSRITTPGIARWRRMVPASRLNCLACAQPPALRRRVLPF